MKYTAEVAGRSFEVEVAAGRVLLDGRAVEARLAGAPGTAIRRLHRGGAVRTVLASPGESRGAWAVSAEGHAGGVHHEPLLLDLARLGTVRQHCFPVTEKCE